MWELSFYTDLTNIKIIVNEVVNTEEATETVIDTQQTQNSPANTDGKAESDTESNTESNTESDTESDTESNTESNPEPTPQPEPITFSYSSSTLFFSNITDISYLPSHNKGTDVMVWSISPALPGGLSLNPASGEISGTMDTQGTSASYTVTATLGSLSTDFQISISPFVEYFLMDSNDIGEFLEGTKLDVIWDTDTLRLEPPANYQLNGLSQTGLKSYFPLDNSGPLANGEALTPAIGSDGGNLNGGVTINYDNGKVGNSLKFAGSSYLLFASSFADDTQDSLSISFWMKLNSTGTAVLSSHWGGSLTTNQGWKIQVDSGPTNLRYSVRGSGGLAETPGTSTLETNRWYHVVGVFDAGSSVTLYLDGKEVGSDTTGVPGATYKPGGFNISMGGQSNGNSRLNGNIDEYAIWTRPLSSLEVDKLYKNSRAKITGSYTSQIIDSKSSAARWSSINWKAVAPYSRSLPLPSEEESQYTEGNADSTILNNIVFKQDFDRQGEETITASDLKEDIDNENPQITDSNSSIRIEDGVVQESLYIEANDYLTFSNRDSLEQGDISISFWMKADSVTGNQVLLDYRGDNGAISSSGWAFELNSTAGNCNSNILCFIGALNNDTAANSHYGTNAVVLEGIWHHVVLTSNQTTNRRRIYFDSEMLMDTIAFQGIGFHDDSLVIGADSSGNNGFAGEMDQLLIWETEISQAVVDYIYNRGIQKISFQIQTCNSSSCLGEQWFGPDGTTNTFFIDNATIPNGVISFPNAEMYRKPYLRYKVEFETYASSSLPAIENIEIRSTVDLDNTDSE